MDWSEVKSLSRVWLFATPWTVAYQDPQSMGFSRQEYWSGLPFPSLGIFPTQGLNLGLLHCRQTLYRLSYQGIKLTQCNRRTPVLNSRFVTVSKLNFNDLFPIQRIILRGNNFDVKRQSLKRWQKLAKVRNKVWGKYWCLTPMARWSHDEGHRSDASFSHTLYTQQTCKGKTSS